MKNLGPYGDSTRADDNALHPDGLNNSAAWTPWPATYLGPQSTLYLTAESIAAAPEAAPASSILTAQDDTTPPLLFSVTPSSTFDMLTTASLSLGFNETV